MQHRDITFVLPGDNLSGGVRVTAIMARLLLARGYNVRIVHPTRWRQIWSDPSGITDHLKPPGGWLRTFPGNVETYANINRLTFRSGEIVIGVGTYTIGDLQRIRSRDVIKVRYNHGLPARMTAKARAAWSLPLPTITVSPTLVPQLEALSGLPVQAVIPNGIDLAEYYPVPGTPRDAIGTIFSLHPNKAPDDIIRLLDGVRTTFPDVPRLVFSTEPRPSALTSCHYERTPSVTRVRELYSRSIAWLLASHNEGLPAPMLEAMACGAVAISTDNDGSLAVIRDGVNGLIVPRGDITAFLDRIHRVRNDAKLRERLTRGGYETVARFTWEKAVTRMQAFLDTLALPVSPAVR